MSGREAFSGVTAFSLKSKSYYTPRFFMNDKDIVAFSLIIIDGMRSERIKKMDFQVHRLMRILPPQEPYSLQEKQVNV